MTTILISGLINLETTVSIPSFPIAYEPVRYPFNGVRTTVAGVGLNIAAALTTLGDDVRLCSLVGKDLAAHTARRELERFALDQRYILSVSDHTAQAVIFYDAAGKRMINTDLKDLQEQTYPADLFDAALDGCALAVLCNINWSRPLLARARARNVPIATDVHAISALDDPYNTDFMAAATILFQSHERLSCAPAEWAAQLRARHGTPIIVVGMGAEGALLSLPHADTIVPAVAPRPIVSTIGAGDALFSAFINGYANGQTPLTALRRAVYFAGYKIGTAGAAEGFLNAHELDGINRA